MDAPSPFRPESWHSRPRVFCPRDASVLVSEFKDKVQYLSCPRCSGWWLPSLAAQAMVGRLPTTFKADSPRIQCPNDRLPLVTIKCKGVEIDLCESCGGVWLDAGEWQRVARRPRRNNALRAAADGGGDLLVEAGGEIVGFVVQCVFEALSGL